MRAPLFSLVIPTYNEEKFLPRLLISLASQTEKNFEVIVVDGPSTDKTRRLASRFISKVPNLSIRFVKEGSPPKQRNVGARLARGKWLIFIDADSALVPTCIERMTMLCIQCNPQFATTWFLPDKQEPAYIFLQQVINIGLDIVRIVGRPLAPGPFMLVERSIFTERGGFDETQGYADDHEFSLRLGKRVPLRIFHEPLCIMSHRRIRRDGWWMIAKTFLVINYFVFRYGTVPKEIPNYITGGTGY